MGRKLLRASTVVALSLVSWGPRPTVAADGPAPRSSPDGIWQIVDRIPPEPGKATPRVRPARYQPATIRHDLMGALLADAPMESTDQALQAAAVITIPMPDGRFERFRIAESPIMEPGLAAKFPEIRTYAGVGLDDPVATVRLDWTPAGFHAQILSPHGSVYVDPYWGDGSALHVSYYKRDYLDPHGSFSCMLQAEQPVQGPIGDEGRSMSTGDTLRTYRLALGTTFEYTQFHGGSVAAAMAEVVTAVNRVDGIYEVDLAIRLILIADNNLLISTTVSDGYTNDNGGAMLVENQVKLDNVVGPDAYDIGHVFSTGGGGLAGLGVVCQENVSFGHKAWGVTGLAQPVGDPFYVDYVAHEMGHQFGANHSFNGVRQSCSGKRNAATAYEPGSGSTIMAYAGICGADDLQPHSDPYFHAASLNEIATYTSLSFGSLCAAATPTGNGLPTVDAGAAYTVPLGTPFALTAVGSDPDEDPLTYCWEEFDLGAAQVVEAPDNGSSPLFRSFAPSPSPIRSFPRFSDLLENTAVVGEQLPGTSRTLTFLVTARDNRVGGGATAGDVVQVSVDGAAGPFAVTSPNSAIVWPAPDPLTVTWNVAGTDGPPVNATSVDILLSLDGGSSFPYVLAADAPNDGAETAIVPDIGTAAARIRVEGSGNIFFDLSDSDFTIQPSLRTPLLAPVPHDRRKNRYISFQPNPPGLIAVGFQVELLELELGSCSGNAARCRLDRGNNDCRVCSVAVDPDTLDPLPCIAVTDCGLPAGQSCALTGQVCVQDLADSIGATWWVGPPAANGVSRLVTEAFAHFSVDWPELVHVGDCEVVPRAKYALRQTEDGVVVSDDLVIDTTTKPGGNQWADGVGPIAYFCEGDLQNPACDPLDNDCPSAVACVAVWLPPDGVTNFDDVNATVYLFQQRPGLTLPHITWVDMHGDGSGTSGSQMFDPPNYVANFADIQFIVRAFQGWPYPFDDPAQCPDVAP